MTPVPFVQRNLLKGTTIRCWVRLRFVAPDGSLHERELIADTGSPFTIILGQPDMDLVSHGSAASSPSSFGQLNGGLLQLQMPELGLTSQFAGYANNGVYQVSQFASPDFAGVAGLAFLRMVEYGGDADAFWIRKQSGGP